MSNNLFYGHVQLYGILKIDEVIKNDRDYNVYECIHFGIPKDVSFCYMVCGHTLEYTKVVPIDHINVLEINETNIRFMTPINLERDCNFEYDFWYLEYDKIKQRSDW